MDLEKELEQISLGVNASNKSKKLKEFKGLINVPNLSAIIPHISNQMQKIAYRDQEDLAYEMLNSVIDFLIKNSVTDTTIIKSLLSCLTSSKNALSSSSNSVYSFSLLVSLINDSSELFDVISEFIYNSLALDQEIAFEFLSTLISINRNIQKQWNFISKLLDDTKFKKYTKQILKFTNELVNKNKGNYAPYASITLYKMLDYLIDNDDDNKIIALTTIKQLTIHCFDEIMKLKEQFLSFLTVMIDNNNKTIAKMSNEILEMVNNEKPLEDDNKHLDGLRSSDDFMMKIEDLEEVKDLIKSKEEAKSKITDKITKKKIPTKPTPSLTNSSVKKPKLKSRLNSSSSAIKDEDKSIKKTLITVPNIETKTINAAENFATTKVKEKKEGVPEEKLKEYEDKISSLLSQMKQMSDKQLELLDIISSLQSSSNNQIKELNLRIATLESEVQKCGDRAPERNCNLNLRSSESVLLRTLNTNDESAILKTVSSMTISSIKGFQNDTINETIRRLCTIATKPSFEYKKNLHSILSFIKTVVVICKNTLSLNEITKRNLFDALSYLSQKEELKDEDIIDISLLSSYLKAK